MDGSGFIWLGSDPVFMKSLAISMHTPFDTFLTSIQLLGDTKELSNSFSQTIAKLCVKQTGDKWLASSNATIVPPNDKHMQRAILEELKLLIKSKPDWFK